MRKRHAQNYTQTRLRLDRLGMLSRLARLKDSAPRQLAIARGLFIAVIAIALLFVAAEKTYTADAEQKPFNPYNKMNVKLYLHNQINDWDQFECAVELAQRESSFRYDAVNASSGAYGLFQHMSEHAVKWDVFEQIDKHVIYVATRYDGSWCGALQHLKERGWH